MASKTVADYLLERLREWDVTDVFAFPGDGINGILAAFGRAVPQDVLQEIKELVEGTDGIEHVVQLLTLQLGPGQVLVAARAEVDPSAPGRDLEQVADEVDRRICESFPDVHHVFLDPTPGAAADPQDATDPAPREGARS